jgi:glycosyltransferase involved in cell wall biosynthesis
MTVAPEISVVIPTCGRSGTLRDVLESLFAQNYDLERVEIIIVIDGDDPRTEALLRDLAMDAPCALRSERQPRSGQGIARNRGIEMASGRIVLMLDDDIIAAPDLMAEHARHHANGEDRVVTGPLPVETIADEPAHQRHLRLWWDGELEAKADEDHQVTFRDFVTGNVSVPRHRLLEVGGFDPAFTGYGREDYELGHRLIRAGLKFVYEPRAVGVHRYTKPALDWLRQWRSIGRADVIFTRKHPEILNEVMALSAFPFIGWAAPFVAIAERVVLALNRRGGYVWSKSAGIAMSVHYWRGVRDVVEDPEEFRHLRTLRWAIRRRRKGNGLIRRLVLNRLRPVPKW